MILHKSKVSTAKKSLFLCDQLFMEIFCRVNKTRQKISLYSVLRGFSRYEHTISDKSYCVHLYYGSMEAAEEKSCLSALLV